MKQIKFPYLRYIVTPPTQKPAKYVYRPVISIKLFLNKSAITFDALIDSGADVYYSHEWDDMPFGLLGQAGFFSHFDIHFNYAEKEILLKYPDWKMGI